MSTTAPDTPLDDAPVTDPASLARTGVQLRAEIATLEGEIATRRAAHAAVEDIIYYAPASLEDVRAAVALIEHAVAQLGQGDAGTDDVYAAIAAACARAGLEVSS